MLTFVKGCAFIGVGTPLERYVSFEGVTTIVLLTHSRYTRRTHQWSGGKVFRKYDHAEHRENRISRLDMKEDKILC